ncbi:DMT family transporter [Commensalibacter papalotli (ex Botero et al. 2024)]|uniref:Permease of the drug/metabolite transporter (DMT) superfamily (RhaT) (PDB:5I20) n=1 Tax=Commensalibacter papalotli (ex Botero et al. 2024) TaxID=2972766 RepID=A0ABM9HQ52_9PROT|nr:EamA family transporter [Commensalibacter papalotli (ex Botero et al. 2024)]CAI3931830.1 Permease of the drug/metabolite transporter (DMT) superfamily (RhaT) (PDB:5I20) [Commensalibacter papalotli (ex Botero et al. 2024)]CAI3943865.1 Permease of the drug/metabolite transporter (DMT) superfamily (RhaT) (PDB:5I20) [Commensalibacter papalotli (ex Botero et al. 2024)]
MPSSISPLNLKKNENIGILCVIVAGCLWGLGGIIGQYALQYKHINTEWMIVIRMGLPGVLILLFSFQRYGREVFAPFQSKNEAFRLIVLAVAGMWISQLTFYKAIQYSNAATATILQYLYPAIIAIFLTIQLKKNPSFYMIVSIFLSIIGAFLLVTNGNFSEIILPPNAIFYGLVSALTSAIYTLYSIPLLQRHNTIIIAGWSMFLGAIIANFFHPFWQLQGNLDFEAWAAILFIIFIGGMAGFILFLVGIKKIGGAKGSVLSTVEPLATVLFSVLLLKINFTLADWIGAGCIIMMIILLSINKPS